MPGSGGSCTESKVYCGFFQAGFNFFLIECSILYDCTKLGIISLIILGRPPARNVHHMRQMWLKSTNKLEIFSYLWNTSLFNMKINLQLFGIADCEKLYQGVQGNKS